ncbi:MAG TPA: DUF1007 family protein [Hyphomicrobiaceae bacterium]|nr:DUF1007 family protein [Hyphomicrobiaceae bacterium]
MLTRQLVAAGAGALILMATPQPVAAHPHVWVKVDTTVVYERGTIVALKQRWVFDEVYSSFAIDGLDKNKDGVFSREELQELAKANMDGVGQFGYFTSAKLDNAPLKFGAPTEFYLEHIIDPNPRPKGAGPATKTEPKSSSMLGGIWNWMVGDDDARKNEPAKVLALTFTLPLSQPVLAEAEGFSFLTRDPTSYIAFGLAAAEPVRLSAGAPKECKARIDAADLDPETKRLEEAFSGAGDGIRWSQLLGSSITIVCDGKS